jgi:hypothetical protein
MFGNKKYILSRNDEFVCEGVTLESAKQICAHFCQNGKDHPQYSFMLENDDGDCFYFVRDRKVFAKRDCT